MVSRSEVCFRAINVIYRNAVVQHIRTALVNKYPDDWQDRLERLFKKEWSPLRKNAEGLRKSGELETPLTDDFDLLSVNHFYNLFDTYYDDLFPETEKHSRNNTKDRRQAILNWARHVKRMRDPVTGHPAETDISVRDTLSMLDSARRLLESIDAVASEQIGEIWEDIRTSDFEANYR